MAIPRNKHGNIKVLYVEQGYLEKNANKLC